MYIGLIKIVEALQILVRQWIPTKESIITSKLRIEVMLQCNNTLLESGLSLLACALRTG